jgi:hypothetical protein
MPIYVAAGDAHNAPHPSQANKTSGTLLRF